MIDLLYYSTPEGNEPFTEWLETLRSDRAKSKIYKALMKMSSGMMNSAASVGGGVHEYKIDFETGYRIYFGNDGNEIVIILAGSQKKDQSKVIGEARAYWQDYKKNMEKQRKDSQHEKGNRRNSRRPSEQ